MISDPTRVKRVLIYRLGSLGDTVVALPALHLVNRTFPNARRVLLTNIPVHAKAPSASAVLNGSGLVDEYMSYPVGTRSPLELTKLWWKIRRFRPQVLVYLMEARGENALRRDAAFFRACGARHIFGLPQGELTHPILDERSGIWEHEASRLVRCLRPFGTPDIHDLRNWDLRLSEEETRKADTVLRQLRGFPMIALGPGTKMQSKDWGEENWRALMGKLSGEFPGYALALVGSKEDAPAGDFAAACWQGQTLNLCGLLSPRETAAVLRGAELFLGPDSGPMHMAAAAGVPCAIVYASRTRRGHWFPIGDHHQVVYHEVECSLCGLEVCIEKQRKCTTSVSVDEMFSAAVQAWKNGRKRDVTTQPVV